MNLQDGNFFVVAKPILVERRQTTPKPMLIYEEDLKVFEEKLEKEKLKEDIALSIGNICNVPYSRKGALDYQEIDVKRVKKVLKKPFKCTICDLSYTKRDSLDRHDKKVHEMKRFRCDLCDKIYKEQGNLSIHKRDVHNIFSIKCSKCGIKFRTKKLLSIHMAVEHDVVHKSLV